MTLPTATPSSVSQTTLDLWNQLGPWQVADNASGIAGKGYPLLTFIDAITSQLAITEAYTRDDATHTGWGQLLDVNVCPTAALPWLAQFAGVQIPVGATDSQMRALIVAQANTQRGTVASLVAILQTFLTGTQQVFVYERTSDAYHFSMMAFASQIVGGAGGAQAIAALAALLAAKPAGLVLQLLIESGPTWEQMYDIPIGSAGTWAVQTDTWASLSNEVPVMP